MTDKEKALEMAIELFENHGKYPWRLYIEKIAEIKRLAGKREWPPVGTLCYVWDNGGRPEKPIIRVYDGDKRFRDGGDGTIFYWKHFEPISAPKLGLWASRDRGGFLNLSSYQPMKRKDHFVFDGELSAIKIYRQSLFPDLTFENSPREI